MPIDLTVILAIGIFAIIITVLIAFVLLRIDNSRTVRENLRLQTAIARSGGQYPAGGQSSEGGEMGWLGTIISEIVTKNPEIIEKVLGGLKKD